MIRRRLRALEALLLLLGATALRRWVPMRRWAPRLIGAPRTPNRASEHEAPVTLADRIVRQAVDRAAARVPLTFTCLDQAVAGAVMLRRRGFSPEVVIGLSRTDARAESHAWLLGSCGAAAIGGEIRDRYQPVTVFRRD